MNSSLTPEQQKQMEAIFAAAEAKNGPPRWRRPASTLAAAAAAAGRRGQGQGRQGQTGRRGRRPRCRWRSGTRRRSTNSFRRLSGITRGQVLLLPPDPEHKYGTLKRLDIMQGITNGTFTELVSGPPELTVGTELVSNITMPWLAAKTTGTTQGNPFSGQQPGRGMRRRHAWRRRPRRRWWRSWRWWRWPVT